MDEGKLSPSDAELIERCLRKDNAAWEQVVARFRRKVFHIAYKFTGKHDEAEDLTQEIFLKVFRSLDKFNRDADFSTWLSSVARNYCIDHYRASKREREVWSRTLLAFDLAPASSGNPHRALEDQDRRSFVRRGLEQLPEKLREAVVLRDLQGLSYQEMATRLALPEGTVKSRINRGREELARLLLRAQQPARRGARATRRPAAGGEVMQLAFEENGDVTDRPRAGGQADLPGALLVLRRGAPAGRGRGAQGADRSRRRELHRQRLHRVPHGHPPPAPGEGRRASGSRACSRGWRP